MRSYHRRPTARPRYIFLRVLWLVGRHTDSGFCSARTRASVGCLVSQLALRAAAHFLSRGRLASHRCIPRPEVEAPRSCLLRSPLYLRRYVSFFCDLYETVLIRSFHAASARAAVSYGQPFMQWFTRQAWVVQGAFCVRAEMFYSAAVHGVLNE